jgi:hypothetical protein
MSQFQPALHPICLLARTDANLTTLFHSFYLVEFLEASKDTKVVQRYPQDRVDTDAIESGLKLFLVDALINRTSLDTTGNFIITPSSFRYFAFFRGFKTRILVAVSNLPIISVARRIFDLLPYEEPTSLASTLLTLCELPVFPSCGLQYDVSLKGGIASVRFSSVEQVEDYDMDYTGKGGEGGEGGLSLSCIPCIPYLPPPLPPPLLPTTTTYHHYYHH